MRVLFKKSRGFTLVELLSVVVIVGILASLAQMSYYSYVETTNNALTQAEMQTIEDKIDQYVIVHGPLPLDLSFLGNPLDQWGNPYQYLNFDTVHGNGHKRKDHNLVPINTDYDFYSMGPDGRSASPLTAQHSTAKTILSEQIMVLTWDWRQSISHIGTYVWNSKVSTA